MADGDFKLTIDARMFNHSGIGKYLQMLLPYICNKYNVTLLGDPEMLSAFSSAATIKPFISPIYSISEQIQYKKLINGSDLFWSPHNNVPLMQLKAKRIVTIHDVYHLAFYNELDLRRKLYAKFVINASIRSSDVIITVSDFSKAEIIKYTGCLPEKIHVIHNGVNQNSVIENKLNVIEKYNLPGKYILFVGNVKAHKNLKTLLKAYKLMSDEFKLVYKIVIAGKRDGFLTVDDELTRWIDANADLKDRILFTGYIDNEDMNVIYQNASLFVFPSVYEGFGLPVLEAMLNKCPVIASHTSSIPEVCGNAALYFNPVDEEELHNKMIAVLTDKKLSTNLIVNGLERIKLFNWDDSAAEHIKIFNKLIKN